MRNSSTPARVLLRAVVLGALHGPIGRQSASYFSNQCPRTFAPKPAYAVRFWRQHRLAPPKVDVLEIIQKRANRFLTNPINPIEAIVREGDSRKPRTFADLPRVRLTVTSPPYYGMRTYLPDQWLRRWFLGGSTVVDYQHPLSQLQHRSPDAYAQQLSRVWTNVAQVSTDDAALVIRFGGIHDRKADPREILKQSLSRSGWKIMTILRAGDAEMGKRQSDQFRTTYTQPTSEFDTFARLN